MKVNLRMEKNMEMGLRFGKISTNIQASSRMERSMTKKLSLNQHLVTNIVEDMKMIIDRVWVSRSTD